MYKERVKWLDVIFWMTQEYYSSQIEYNIWRDSIRCFKVKKFYDRLDTHKQVYYVTDDWPSYVWTHIHFLLAKWETPITFKLRRKKYQVFLNLLRYYNKTFRKIIATSEDNNHIRSCFKDIERLIANHNINIYRDSNFFDWQLARIRKKITWLKYYYTNWRNKPKYQPMLWANPTPGKPLTLSKSYTKHSCLRYYTLESYNKTSTISFQC